MEWYIEDHQKQYIKDDQKWRIKDKKLKAWVSQPIDGCSYIGSAAKADLRDAIVDALFRGLPYFACQPNKEADHIHERTKHDYNGYGCSWVDDPYEGGHAGWDVQTCSVAGTNFAHEPFYSLTAGKIIAADENDNYNTIAIFDGQKTTLYLHAREIDADIKNSVGKDIGKGTYLGIQGNVGLWPENVEKLPDRKMKELEPYLANPENYSEHVHIEVRKGEIGGSAKGAEASEKTEHPTMDPIYYLYRWVNGCTAIGNLDHSLI